MDSGSRDKGRMSQDATGGRQGADADSSDIVISLEKPATSFERKPRTSGEPDEATLFGRVGEKDLKVYVGEDVWEGIANYCRRDMERELGGVLLGDLYETQKGVKFLKIEGYVEAKYGKSAGASFTFTHEAWNHIHREKENLHPELSIVGWYHTHPGYGIFLSSYDQYIQNNFFDLPHQVALVVDPRRDKQGFFQWSGGVIRELGGYYLHSERIDLKRLMKAVKELTAQVQSLKEIGRVPPPARWKDFAIAGLAVALVLSSVYSLVLINGQNDNLQRAITETQNKIEETRVILDERLAEVSTIPQGNVKPDATPFIHPVKEGETLWGISKRHLARGSRYKDIQALNKIADPDRIFPGQRLTIPSK